MPDSAPRSVLAVNVTGGPELPVLPAVRWGERFRAVVVPDPAPEGWTSATDLVGDGLSETLRVLAELRGAPHPAVAGTLLMGHYAGRVVPVALATWFEHGRVLDARMSGVRLRLDGPRILAVGFPDDGEVIAPDRGACLLGDRLVAGNLALAIEAVHEATRAGRRALRGAVAHAVTTAFLALSWSKPEPSHHLGVLCAFLERHGLADTVAVDAREVAGRRWLYAERRTCCLAFRTHAHAGEYCATCPITPEADRHRSFVDAARTYRARHPSGSP